MTQVAPFDPHLDEPEEPLYTARRQIYPQSVHGVYRRTKWLILFVTLGIYYFLPFVRWDRGAGAPNQAVLVDLPHRRAYFFFIEIWPQEVYYLTGLLIIAAMTLFLMNAMAGRVWCGYLCPQTVWTDLFMQVERWVEGDRRERMQRDAGPMDLEKFSLKLLKHSLWLLIAWWTGGAWVLYFADAPTLVHDLVTFQGDMVAYGSIAILTFTTYTFAGLMREQVCLYMCPWPRIQAAMTDEYALNVTYRVDRGEPRMSFKKATQARNAGQIAGDCIDCQQCVAVCPTGVDIRHGADLGCYRCRHATCDHEAGDDGPQLARDAEHDDLRHKRFRAVAIAADEDLQAQHGTGEERGETDHRQREVADAQHLLADEAHVDRRAYDVRNGIAGEQREPSGFGQKRQHHAPDDGERVETLMCVPLLHRPNFSV
jgi:polyferredoxin